MPGETYGSTLIPGVGSGTLRPTAASTLVCAGSVCVPDVTSALCGAPNDNAGKGNAFGGRVALGIGTITLTAGVASWKPDSVNDRVTSYGGTAAFRMIGGSLIPLSVGLQLGATHSAEVTSGTQTIPGQTRGLAGVGC